MVRNVRLLVLGVLCVFVTWTARVESATPTAVVCAKDAAAAEKLAAKEVRRYVYLRTGHLLPIVEEPKAAPQGGVITVGKGAMQAFGLQPEGLVLEICGPSNTCLSRASWMGGKCWRSSAAMRSGRSTERIVWPSTWVCGSICTATWYRINRYHGNGPH